QYPGLKTKNGDSIYGLMSSIKYLTRQHMETNYLLGDDVTEQTLVNQWLEYRLTKLNIYTYNDKEIPFIFNDLNDWLIDKVFFIGHKLSLADVVMYYGLYPFMRDLTVQDKELHTNLSRWFKHIQSFDDIRQSLNKIIFPRVQLY
ncbi:hypothetical protein HELRODRAFT_91562, partial [Helobdella robusta]|uniref:GST C-terminal domain-containing protein n=1 Tax=Helobdella robusta TaxID=6412 RepID=T1G855_HELRO